MATTLEILQEKLTDAQSAYHEIQLGRGVREIKDQNGESVVYNAANLAKLKGYMNELELQIAALSGTSATNTPTAIRMFI